MAELNSNEEPQLLPPKRKQPSQNLDVDDSTKKLRTVDEPLAAVEEKPLNENGGKDEIKDAIEDEEEEEDYEGEDEVDSDDEDDGDDDEEEVERFNGGDEIDGKGKGIMKDDKGKGKMIEESEDDDDDDDDSSDEDGGAGESDGDDDFSDDSLAEVDLDNILPSRTRRRTAPKGVRISGDDDVNDKENDA